MGTSSKSMLIYKDCSNNPKQIQATKKAVFVPSAVGEFEGRITVQSQSWRDGLDQLPMMLTINGAYRSDNNLIQVHSSQMANNYLVEFEEMFLDHQFGSASPANTPNPILTVDGTRLEVFFSPDDGTIERLLELVKDAQDEILFMAFSFTDDDLAQAILDRAGEGIVVAGVFDKSQALSNVGGEYAHFIENGIAVRLDGNSMHHKVIIIDERIVVTGSYNFSNTRNDENTLVIHDPEIAEFFREEFARVWGIVQKAPE